MIESFSEDLQYHFQQKLKANYQSCINFSSETYLSYHIVCIYILNITFIYVFYSERILVGLEIRCQAFSLSLTTFYKSSLFSLLCIKYHLIKNNQGN